VDHAITLGRLRDEPCPTRSLKIHGYVECAEPAGCREDPLEVYGSDAAKIRALAAAPALARQLNPKLPYIAAEAVWAPREEMARNVEDMLARRTRALFLNARAASEMAGPVAQLMARELGRDEAWIAEQMKNFCELAKQYMV